MESEKFKESRWFCRTIIIMPSDEMKTKLMPVDSKALTV